MSGLIDGLKDKIQAFIGRTPDSPSRQTNDAAPPTTRTPTESHRPSPPIDLTSPTQAGTHRARPQSLKRYSDEEQRLVKGAYGVPSDAVPVPDPTSLLSGSTKTSMVKPGAANSLKPIDTLNHNPSRGYRTPAATYGRRTGTRLKFLDGQSSISPNYEPVAKRRRLDTVPTASSQTGQLGHGIGAMAHSPFVGGVRQSPLTQQRPTTSSRYSDGREKKAMGGAGRVSQNEADSTENMNKYKSRARHPTAYHSPPQKSPRQSVNGSLRSDPILLDEEPTSKFSGFEQGIDHAPNKDVPTPSPETTSKHFPTSKAKMTHSTDPPRGDTIEVRRMTVPTSTPLRNQFRRVGPRVLNQEEISDDELAPPRKRNMSSTKPTSKVKVAPAIQRAQGVSRDERSLIFARAPGFESREPGLSLNSKGRLNAFRIAASAETETTYEFDFDLSNVVKGSTDNVSRIRLVGPRKADGAQLCVDIQFEKNKDLLLFQSEVQRSITDKALRASSVTDMAIIFNKPLPKSMLVGSVPTLSTHVEEKVAPKIRPPGIINGLTAPATNGRSRVQQSNDGIAAQSEGTSSHTGRTSGRKRPNYRETEEETAEEPERFSEIYGLGAPWEHQLTYGSGRRRATVDFTDLPRLDEGEFLNDQLIDFYSLYLFNQAKNLSDKVYIFNTHFFSTLTRKVPGQRSLTNYAAVARWTSREDLFGYDYIVVPINQDVHWYLAIICNVSSISRKPAMEDSKVPMISEPKIGQAETGATRSSPALLSEECPPVSDGAGDEMPLQSEESKLNVADDLANGSEADHIVVGKPHVPNDSPKLETARMEQLTLGDSTPNGILPGVSLPSVSKKSKRKSGPPARKWATDEPTIIILDSLGSGARSQAVRALKDYLLQEGREKRGIEAVIPQNAFYARGTQIPMQENFSDCGVYLLGYMQKFFEAPDGFKERLLSGDMRLDTDWPQMAMPEMRGLMRDILQGLYKTQQEERKRAKAEKRANKVAMASNPITAPTKHAASNTRPSPIEGETFEEPTADEARVPVKPSVAASNENIAESTLSPSTGRLASPFRPTPVSKLTDGTRSSTPETKIMKVDDSSPPWRSNEDQDDMQRSWLERQDDLHHAPGVPLRRASPQVVISSPKRRREFLSNLANGVRHTIEVHSPKRLKTETQKLPVASKDLHVVEQTASTHEVIDAPTSPVKTAVLPQTGVVPAHDAARFSPAQSPALDSRGRSHNPIPLDDSQEIITVSSPKRGKQVNRTPSIKRDLPSNVRSHTTSLANEPVSLNTLRSLRAKTNEAGGMAQSAVSRVRAAKEEARKLASDTVPETPSDGRLSPSGTGDDG